MLQAKLSLVKLSHWKVYHSAGLRANRPTEHLFALWLSLSALGTWLQLSRNTVGAGVNSSSSPTCEGFINVQNTAVNTLRTMPGDGGANEADCAQRV